MRRFFRVLSSVRWPILLLLAPLFFALSTLDGSGGWPMFITTALLVLFWGLLNDASQIERARNPRLGLAWDRYGWSLDTVLPLRTIVGAAALLSILVLLVVAPGLGLWALAAWLILMLLCWLETKLDGQRRYWMVELLIPLATTILPTLIVAHAITAASQSAADAAAETAAEAAAVTPTLFAHPGIALLALLVAFILGSLILLCLIRDEVPDRALGYSTTATTLGRSGATVLLAGWHIATIAVAAIGIQAGTWNWAIPTILASGIIATHWLIAHRADANAVSLWWLVATAAVWLGAIA